MATMTNFAIPPDQAGYSVSDGIEVISTKLAGGASRYRRDIIGATSTVNVSWSVNPDEYRYIRAFYNAITEKGAFPFTIDLILDRAELTNHKAYFIPGSMKTTGQSGLTYYVSAQLEVYPIESTISDADYVFAYNMFGNDLARIEDRFDKIINVDFPRVL